MLISSYKFRSNFTDIDRAIEVKAKCEALVEEGLHERSQKLLERFKATKHTLKNKDT